MPLPHLQNLQQFTQFIRRASLAEINALRAEDLPYGVDTELVLEAPLEYSEQLREVIIRAKKIQHEQHADKLAADLGEYGAKVIALANDDSISAPERIFNKQIAGLNSIKLQLKQQYSEAGEQLLLKLREELNKSSIALQNYANELKAMRDFAKERSIDKTRRQFITEYKQAEQGINSHLIRLLASLNGAQNLQQSDTSELLQGSAHKIDTAVTSVIKLQLALASDPNSKDVHSLNQNCMALAHGLPPSKFIQAIEIILKDNKPKAVSLLFTLIQRLCIFCERLPKLAFANPQLIGSDRQQLSRLIDQQFGIALHLVKLFIDHSSAENWQQLAMHAKAFDLQQQQQALTRSLASAKTWK